MYTFVQVCVFAGGLCSLENNFAVTPSWRVHTTWNHLCLLNAWLFISMREAMYRDIHRRANVYACRKCAIIPMRHKRRNWRLRKEMFKRVSFDGLVNKVFLKGWTLILRISEINDLETKLCYFDPSRFRRDSMCSLVGNQIF